MKMMLKVEDLAVDSFDTATGGGAPAQFAAAAITPATACFCTDEAGCYPSLYCSLYGPYQLTCQEGCMTNANGYC